MPLTEEAKQRQERKRQRCEDNIKKKLEKQERENLIAKGVPVPVVAQKETPVLGMEEEPTFFELYRVGAFGGAVTGTLLTFILLCSEEMEVFRWACNESDRMLWGVKAIITGASLGAFAGSMLQYSIFGKPQARKDERGGEGVLPNKRVGQTQNPIPKNNGYNDVDGKVFTFEERHIHWSGVSKKEQVSEGQAEANRNRGRAIHTT